MISRITEHVLIFAATFALLRLWRRERAIYMGPCTKMWALATSSLFDKNCPSTASDTDKVPTLDGYFGRRQLGEFHCGIFVAIQSALCYIHPMPSLMPSTINSR
ncbi:hypothetical protein HMPREF2615_17990 [Pseudomonas aeruginosa]|nr:hypothetical protein HMPREF2615_17990 [Pseudomonas aeruginosa]